MRKYSESTGKLRKDLTNICLMLFLSSPMVRSPSVNEPVPLGCLPLLVLLSFVLFFPLRRDKKSGESLGWVFPFSQSVRFW